MDSFQTDVSIVTLEIDNDCYGSYRILRISATAATFMSSGILVRDRFAAIVNDAKFSQLPDFVTEATGITQKMVNEGITTESALVLFFQFLGRVSNHRQPTVLITWNSLPLDSISHYFASCASGYNVEYELANVGIYQHVVLCDHILYFHRQGEISTSEYEETYLRVHCGLIGTMANSSEECQDILIHAMSMLHALIARINILRGSRAV